MIVLEHGWHCRGRMKLEANLARIKSSAQACTTPNSHLRWPYRFSCAMFLGPPAPAPSDGGPLSALSDCVFRPVRSFKIVRDVEALSDAR